MYWHLQVITMKKPESPTGNEPMTFRKPELRDQEGVINVTSNHTKVNDSICLWNNFLARSNVQWDWDVTSRQSHNSRELEQLRRRRQRERH